MCVCVCVCVCVYVYNVHVHVHCTLYMYNVHVFGIRGIPFKSMRTSAAGTGVSTVGTTSHMKHVSGTS